VGPLALATIDFPATVACNVDRLDQMTIRYPTMGAECMTLLALAFVADFPTTGGHCRCLAAVGGYLATGCGLVA